MTYSGDVMCSVDYYVTDRFVALHLEITMSTSKDVGEQLDEVVVEFMCSMKKLEHLREKYTAAVGEVCCMGGN